MHDLRRRRRTIVRAQPHRYPGHADFTYEVSRALAAAERAVLVVDASQGIEVQTQANVYMAMEPALLNAR